MRDFGFDLSETRTPSRAWKWVSAWSSAWLYVTLGLFNEYRVVYYQPRAKALPEREVP